MGFGAGHMCCCSDISGGDCISDRINSGVGGDGPGIFVSWLVCRVGLFVVCL